MEDQFVQFTTIDEAFFNQVDKIIEEGDIVSQAIFIVDMVNSLLGEEDILKLTMPVSVIASIVCDQEDDVFFGDDGFVSDESQVMVFSDAIYDLWFDCKEDNILPYVEYELIQRERYELLNEIQKLKNEEKDA